MNTSILIEGKISVETVLHSKYRKVLTLFYDVAKLQRKRSSKQSKSVKRIIELVKSRDIKIEAVDSKWFEKNVKGKTHGGIAALISERTYQKIHELLKSKPRIYFYLDGIEDPYNLGYTIRSLFAAGINGILMRKRDWHEVESLIIKSSAGTSELMPIVLVEDLIATLDIFKSNNYTIACTDKDNGQSLYKSSLKPPLFIVIGGEKRGINRTLLDKSDVTITIPYKREFTGSLPLHSAATIIGFEILRQQQYDTPK